MKVERVEMNIDPVKQLREGARILDPLMNAHGFTFSMDATGKGSGGHFAQGSYRHENRRLELHYRFGLGVVIYHMGEFSLEHGDYMRLLGVHKDSKFCSASLDTTLDGFSRLKEDLECLCTDFLAGDGKPFIILAENLRNDPNMFKGLKAAGK